MRKPCPRATQLSQDGSQIGLPQGLGSRLLDDNGGWAETIEQKDLGRCHTPPPMVILMRRSGSLILPVEWGQERG